jgi:acyl-CoA thioester hydrolase
MTAFAMPHRVRSFEVDHQGFLFNGRYLEIADAAMTEWFRHLGFDYPAMLAAGYDPSVVRMEVDFAAPGRLDDDLRVTVTCERVGTTSTVLRFGFMRDGATLATLRSTYVNVEADEGRSRPIPTALREQLVSQIERIAR